MTIGNSLQIAGVGTTITSSGTNQNATIPDTADANVARVVRVVSDGVAFVKVGAAATANDIMITTEPTLLFVESHTTIGVIEGSTGAKVNITPVER